MNIQLKDVEINDKFSEETIAFTGQLIVDGELVANLANRGCGGPHEIRPVESKSYKDIKKIDEWCKSHLPKWGSQFGDGDVYETDLELHISIMLEDERKIQDMRKLLRNNIIIIDDDCKSGEHYKVSKKKVKTFPLGGEKWEKFLSRYKNPIILNDINPLEAFRVMMHGKLKFSIGGEPDQPVYEGVNYGFCGETKGGHPARWNGWLVPAVTKNVFDQIVKDQEAHIGKFSEGGATPFLTDEDVIENFEVLKNTKPIFPCRSADSGLYVLDHGWIWDEV